MNDFKRILTTYAEDPYITHDDVTKCGQCWRARIQSEVAKEILDYDDVVDVTTLQYCEKETKRRWQQTELYLRVTKLMSEGIPLEEVEKLLSKEGIEI